MLTNHGGDAAPIVTAWQIGEWCVAPAVNEIRGDGEILRVEPKAMEVLVFLANRAGQVVSRDELLSALWPGVVVGDDALSQAVIKLRKALRDPAKSPQYIETIPKRGYRLISPVAKDAPVRGGSSGQAVEEKAPIPDAARARWLPRAAWIVLALVVTAAAAIVVFRATQTERNGPTAEISVDGLAVPRSTGLPTVTVMPFEALADDANQAYLAQGITSDLTTDLSRIAGLRVVSGRTSSTATAARYVVSGSVQRTSDGLKVNARLTDSQSGQQLWAERYEAALGDSFKVNEEIVGQLLDALSVQVSKAERRRVAGRYTRNLNAYDYFLRGQAGYLVRAQPENETARELYRKAIELDPTFARAYAGLALTHSADYRNQWTVDLQQALARAGELAETAVRMDPQLPEVYGTLAYVRSLQGRSDQAIASLKQAITLDPFYVDGYANLGAIYTHVGQPARAVPLLRTAMRLNPDAGFIYFLVLGRAYLFQGDTEQATINLKEALSRNASDLETRVFMAATLVAAGDLQNARWEAEEVRVLQPGFAARQWLQTYPMTDAGQRQRLTTLLAQVGL